MSDTKSVIIDAMSGAEGAQLQISQFTDNFDTVKFCLDSSLKDYNLMIVTENEGVPEVFETDGERLYTEYDESNGEFMLVWHPGREITCASGLVVYQIAAYRCEGDEVVSTWYSKEGRIIVSDSVDTTAYSTALIGSYPNLVTRLILETGNIRSLVQNINESKVDKTDGYGLSQNDFTDECLAKLQKIEDCAEVNIIEKVMLDGSELKVDESDRSVKLALKDKFDAKVDKIEGMQLSTNDYTDGDAVKLAGIEYFAQANVQADWNEADSGSDAFIKNRPDLSKLQSDWDESDAGSASYIKNKPDMINFVRKDFPDLTDMQSVDFADSLIGEGYGTTVYYGAKCDWNNYMLIVVATNEDAIRYFQFGMLNSDGGECESSSCPWQYRYGEYESYEDYETGETVWYINWSSWFEFLTVNNVERVLHPAPVTVIPSVLKKNTSYNFGELTELSLKFPTDANDGDVIYLTFESGAEAADLYIDTSNTSDIDITTEAGTGYEIFGKYNGKRWIVNYSDYTVSNYSADFGDGDLGTGEVIEEDPA